VGEAEVVAAVVEALVGAAEALEAEVATLAVLVAHTVRTPAGFGAIRNVIHSLQTTTAAVTVVHVGSNNTRPSLELSLMLSI
jgi:hypothetical protein